MASLPETDKVYAENSSKLLINKKIQSFYLTFTKSLEETKNFLVKFLSSSWQEDPSF